MQLRLLRNCALLLSPCMAAFLCNNAQAQTSVIAKKLLSDPFAPAVSLSEGCKFGAKGAPCRPLAGSTAAGQQFGQAPLPNQAEAAKSFQMEPSIGETESAVNAAVSALFKVHTTVGLGQVSGMSQPEDSVQTINPFQLSQNLQWRVEPGELDSAGDGVVHPKNAPSNEVGIYASETLFQPTPTGSFNLEAGVITSAGGAAGKAGIAVAW